MFASSLWRLALRGGVGWGFICGVDVLWLSNPLGVTRDLDSTRI